MLASGNGVQGDSDLGKVAGDPFELTVHQHDCGREASLFVDIANVAGCLDKCFMFLVGNEHGCAELNVAGDSHKKRKFVDKHDVRTDDDITVLGHELRWYWHCSHLHVICTAAHRLSFQRPDVGPEDLFRYHNVFAGHGAVRQEIHFDDPDKFLCRWASDHLLGVPSQDGT